MTRFAIAIVCRSGSVGASAHDFWIEPSTFHPAVGDRVTAALRVGQKLAGDPLPKIPPLIDRFVVRGASAERPVVGRAGADPAGIAFIAEGGTALDRISEQRRIRWRWKRRSSRTTFAMKDSSESSTHERRTVSRPRRDANVSIAARRRCSTRREPAAFDAPLGFTLELVPRKNPYAMKNAGELPLALTFRGKPIANVLVVAMSKRRSFQGRSRAHRREGPRDVAARARRILADQGRAHGSGARRCGRRLGKLVGVDHVRAAQVNRRLLASLCFARRFCLPLLAHELGLGAGRGDVS